MSTVNAHQSAIPKAFVEIFYKRILEYNEVPKDEVAPFLSTFKPMPVKRGQYLLKEGQVCRELFFIIKGYVRLFVHDKDKEVNLHFYFENELASDFRSLHNEEPSHRNMVAMSSGLVLVANKASYIKILESSQELSTAAMRFFQSLFLEEEEHSEMLKSMTPEERYRYTMEHHPHLLSRVPLTHLASYLGVGRESLSRIRKKLNS